MGLSGSKQTSTTKPIYSGQVEGAASDISNTLHQQLPKITGVTDQLGSLVPGLIDQYKNGDPNVNAALGFNSDVLSGKYLNSNPYLEGVISNLGNDVRNQTAGALGVHGNWGDSSAMADIVSRNVANAAGNMRFNNYNNGLTMMGQQASLSPTLAASKYLPVDQATNIAQAQQIPVQAAVGAGNGIGGLLGQYTNQTTKSKQGIGSMLLNAAAAAAQAYASCDVRLKENIRAVGKTDEGLPIYSFNYKGDPEPRMGPMAQEVAIMQPENLGPEIDGYLTVKLGSVR